MKTTPKRYLIVIIVAFIAALSCIQPIYPKQMVLQHLGTVLLLAVLVIGIRSKQMPRSAFWGVVVFTLLHILGARYIYSYVPYNDWMIAWFDVDVQALFGWERNHFDRLVHFMFGVCFLPYAVFLFRKWTGLTYRQRLFVAFLSVQGFSLLYELFEWGLTLAMAAETAENYNGQQGDVWDAHKDMALAFLGSLCTASMLYLRKRNQLHH